MLITCDKYGPIQFQSDDQATVACVPGLKTGKASGRFGKIRHQFYESANFIIHYFHLDISEELILRFASPNAASLKCKLCLKDEMTLGLDEKYVSLPTDQYIIFGGNVQATTLKCIPQATYQFLTIDYPEEALIRFRQQYAHLDEWISRQLLLLTGGNTNRAYASNNFRMLFTDITASQLPVILQAPWLHNKLGALLIDWFWDLHNNLGPNSLSLNDIATRGRNFIVQNVSQQCSVKDVAQHLGIKERLLSARFEKRYGTKIADFLREERLKYARHLLLTTDLPIKVIAGMAVFKHTTNFSKSFRDYFTYTPGSLRDPALPLPVNPD